MTSKKATSKSQLKNNKPAKSPAKKKNQGGPVPKFLDPEIRHVLLEALRFGLPYRIACYKAGIHESSLRDWRAKARGEKKRREAGQQPNKDLDIYLQFYDELCATEANVVIDWMAVIDSHAVKSWQAAVWRLERRFPLEFARSTRELVAVDVDKDINEQDSAHTNEERLAKVVDIFHEALQREKAKANTSAESASE